MNIFTDHKPLIGLLQNRDFDEISNPRIARMVEKTLRWGFKIHHIPGLQNSSCDALSRFPWGQEGDIDLLEFEDEYASICTQEIGAVDWDQVIKESKTDEEIQVVRELIETGNFEAKV